MTEEKESEFSEGFYPKGFGNESEKHECLIDGHISGMDGCCVYCDQKTPSKKLVSGRKLWAPASLRPKTDGTCPGDDY